MKGKARASVSKNEASLEQSQKQAQELNAG